MAFQKATKEETKLRLALIGPSGSGKTYSALRIATGLGGKIAVIDSEHRSARKYSDKFIFDVQELESFHPQKYIDAIKEAQNCGYDALIIDSFSHAWAGVDGALDQADKAAIKEHGNRFAAWRHVTPLHNRLVEAIIQSDLHVIVTMRAKTEYAVEKDEKGKTSIKKLGVGAVQREGVEYEFDVVCDIDLDHNLIVGKTRYEAIDGLILNRPDEEFGRQLLAWLSDAPQTSPKFVSAQEEPAKQEAPEPQPSNRQEPEQPHEPLDPTQQNSENDNYDEAKDTQWADPDQAGPKIRALIENLPVGLKTMNPELPPGAILCAQMLCCEEFGVANMSQISEQDSEKLRAFMRSGMVQTLREKGYLPPPRTR